MQTRETYWSDATWVDRDTCARFNPQNERKYYSKLAKKDEEVGELRKPIRQHAPGVMVRITVTAAEGGTAPKPRSVEPKKRMTAEFYVSMQQTDVMPQVATVAPERERFLIRQDPHHELPQEHRG